MSTHDAPAAAAAQDVLFWRDEILQVMWWYRGEGLGDRVSVPELARFLAGAPAALQTALDTLVQDGLLEVVGDPADPRYAFTPQGGREGARRFADEFQGMTSQGHGECGPDCPHCEGESRDTCVHCAPQADA